MAHFEELYNYCFNSLEKTTKPILQVIGGGKMATALIEGFVKAGSFYFFL